MPKKKSKKRTNTQNNNRLWFIVTFLIILIVSLFLGYYFSTGKDKDSGKKTPEQITVKKNTGNNKPANPLNGTWVSEYDGAIMEIKNKSFTLEMPSVNEGSIIKGNINISGNEALLIYVSGSESCKEKSGKYRFEIKNEKLYFKLINDDCKIRAERMSVPWYKL